MMRTLKLLQQQRFRKVAEINTREQVYNYGI